MPRLQNNLRLFKTLYNLWTDVKSPAAFAGANRLYLYAKSLNVGNVTLMKVKQFLSQQPSYYENRPQKRSFKHNPIIVQCPFQEIQADLGDFRSLRRYNKQYQWLLVLIDAFSRFVWTVPLKNKTSKEVKHALETSYFLKKFPTMATFFVDNGLEFKGAVSEYLTSKQVTIYRSRNPVVKAALAENFMKSFKTKLFKYFAHSKTYNYVSVVSDLTDAYNKSTQKNMLGFSPEQILKNKRVQMRIYKEKFAIKWSKAPIKLQMGLKIGDYVVTALQRYRAFEKGFQQNFSHKIYQISRIDRYKKRPLFILKDLETKEILPTRWYAEELQKVPKPAKTRRRDHMHV
jgi:hypothetical protein